MSGHFLLSVFVFSTLLLTTHTVPDHGEIITEEDIRAFEETVAEDRRPSSVNGFSLLTPETKLIDNRRTSGRSRKVNSRAQLTLRKRGRHRPLLRRSGMALTNNRRVVLRKRKKKPASFPRRRVSGDSPLANTNRRGLTHQRLLGKSEPVRIQQRPLEQADKSIERAVLEALEAATETTTTEQPKNSQQPSMLKMTPPRRGESFLRVTIPTVATTVETTTNPAVLDDLIAALESIEPPEFAPEVDETPTTTSTSTTTSTTTTTTTETTTTTVTLTTTTEATTVAPLTTMEMILLSGSTAEETAETTTMPTTVPPRTRPTAVPSTDEEAQRLVDEIEKNFIEPEPPAPQPVGPPAPPPVRAPPGELPPNDLVVSELNTADDFLAVARRLQLFRRKQTQL